MLFLRTLLSNHVLANLFFALVLVVGFLSYQMLPRQQDPTINFNWLVVTTIMPGASATDIEKRVTDPLEDAIRNIKDLKFVSSNSRENLSSMLIRFEDIDDRTFDKRVTEVRREILNTKSELPAAALDSLIIEITSGNAFPTATVAVTAESDGELLRRQSQIIRRDLEQLAGVDRVDAIALNDPELHIDFDPAKLEARAISPSQLAETIRGYFEDVAAGNITIGQQNWVIRLIGTQKEPGELAQRPIIGVSDEVTLGDIAKVRRGRAKATEIVRHNKKPAVMFAIMKQDSANNLELVETIKTYLQNKNQLADATGVKVSLIDDQTIPTKDAINLMQTNAFIGLLMVLVVAWFFLGTRIAVLTAIGIPFILAGTFWVLMMIGETLNVTVLLGVIIVLGMLVDDAVVIVESMYYRLRHGVEPMTAAIESLKEVALPVTTAVFTTIAAFMPLMLLPGILGDFMRVIPMVVTLALLLSLVEAFWMLPAHVIAAKIDFSRTSRMHQFRERFAHKLQITYVRTLIKAMRRPVLSLSIVLLMFFGAVFALATDRIKMDFFAADTLRLFYVNVEMPSETPLHQTMDKVEQIEQIVRKHLKQNELRAMLAYSGQMFTEMEPRRGEQYGQVMLGLHPRRGDMRSVEQIIESMREEVTQITGPLKISFLKLAGGPPVAKPISVKVRGDQYADVVSASKTLKSILKQLPDVIDIEDDASKGRMELQLTMNHDAVRRSGLSPDMLKQTLRLLVDGEVLADLRDDGEKVEVRLRANPDIPRQLEDLMGFRLPIEEGGSIALTELFDETRKLGLGNIRHYNFRRAITVEADLKANGIDTVAANKYIVNQWAKYQTQYPTINLDFSGELDDIQDSLDAIGVLFILGVGVMYMLLGAQFHSYWQPLIILSTIFMAFTGVIVGLLVSGNAMSLYTLYGVVALAGIAVNAAIVLISAANARLNAGMRVRHATLYAARRRVIPILITSLTTIAGLFSLATGLGGASLIWGPVASAIVWGLLFSSVLTLFLIPLLYQIFMNWSHR